ncbi:MAG: hypothetical protein PHG35_02215 [Dehalococcoidales bacterium]|nr:hypothetical protein [Dehalococcoidales bacterium]
MLEEINSMLNLAILANRRDRLAQWCDMEMRYRRPVETEIEILRESSLPCPFDQNARCDVKVACGAADCSIWLKELDRAREQIGREN